MPNREPLQAILKQAKRHFLDNQSFKYIFPHSEWNLEINVVECTFNGALLVKKKKNSSEEASLWRTWC